MDDLDQTIMDFLEGRLSHKEERAFQKRIEADPDLESEIKDYQRMLNAFQVKRLEKKKQQIRTWRQKGGPRQQPKPRKFKYRRLIIGLAAAASVALFISYLIPWWDQESSDKNVIVENYGKPLFSLSANVTPTNIIEFCANEFDREETNYNLIIDTLNTIDESDGVTYANAQYMLAHAYLKNGIISEDEQLTNALSSIILAERYISQINLTVDAEDLLTSWQVSILDVLWYKSLIYIALDQKTMAIRTLNELLASDTLITDSLSVNRDFLRRAENLLNAI